VENSCRSQIAEGFAKRHSEDVLEAFSAGGNPSGRVNDTAIAVMKEKGIDISHQRSKSLFDIPQIQWDYVVTMGCGDGCPNVTAKNRLDWQIPDPKGLVLDEFRNIRDRIEAKVLSLIRGIESKIRIK